MKKLIVVITILFPAFLQARGSEAATENGETFSSDKVSSFMVSAGSGMAYPRLLNQDGTYAVFQGYPFVLEGEFKFLLRTFGIGAGFFGHYSSLQADNTANNSSRTQSILLQDTLLGVKMNLHPFFGGMGYGTTQGSITETQSGSNISVTGTLLGFTGGLRLFTIGQIGVTFQGWYKSSTFQKSQNSGLTNNATLERIDFLIMLSLDPVFNIL